MRGEEAQPKLERGAFQAVQQSDLPGGFLATDGLQQTLGFLQVGADELTRVGEADERDELIDRVRRAGHPFILVPRRVCGEGEGLGNSTHEGARDPEKHSPDPRGRGFE